jgi:hypothetical protein
MSDQIEIVHSLLEIPSDTRAIAALGKQYGVASNHEDILAAENHLSEASEITVRGVGYACLNAMDNGQELRVLFTGNKKALFTSAALEFMAKEFPDVPEYWYDRPDEGSVTTEDSAIRVPAILRAEGHERAAIGTVSYHARRSSKKFTRTDERLFSCVIATDSIVAEHTPEDAEYIESWRSTSQIKKERIKEAVGLVVETGRIGKAIRAGVKLHRP